MDKKKLIIIFTIMFSILLGSSFTFATQSFSVSPTSFSQTVNTNTGGSNVVTVRNTGNESINLTISKTDYGSGANSIPITLSKTSIVNLAPSSSTTFNYSYSGTSNVGTYTGSITIVNAQNSSQIKTVPLTLTVSPASTGNADLTISGETSTIYLNADLGLTERINLRFNNVGTVNLTNIRFSPKELFGNTTNDVIPSYDVNFDTSGFSLNVGQSKTVQLSVYVPNSVALDTYLGSFAVNTNEGYSFDWNLQLALSGSSVNVVVDQNSQNVIGGLMLVSGQAGDTIRNNDFTVDNIGNVNAQNLVFELKSNLVEESTGATMPASAVSFSPTQISSLNTGNTNNVEVRVNIPSDQGIGNYYATVNLKSATTGVIYSSFMLEVQVTGDVYLKDLSYPTSVTPGSTINLIATIKNKGLQIHRNVIVTGTISNIDSSNTDLTQSSSPFILNVNSESNQTLQFNIPEDASNGDHTLLLKVQFDNQQFTIIKNINIVRPTHNILVDSYNVNPQIISCDKKIYSTMRLRNLGKFDEQVQIQTQVQGTTLSQTSNDFTLKVDDSIQKSSIMDLSSLKPGNYSIAQKVIYGGNLFKKEITPITIINCTKTGIGVSVNNTVPGQINQTNASSVPSSKISIFGTQIDNSTFYISLGLGVVVILIIISLFML